MSKKGVVYSTLGTFGCLVVFLTCFYPHDDPIYIFNSMTNFIADFSQFAAGIGEGFKKYVLFNEKMTVFFRDTVDLIFTTDVINIYGKIFRAIKNGDLLSFLFGIGG